MHWINRLTDRFKAREPDPVSPWGEGTASPWGDEVVYLDRVLADRAMTPEKMARLVELVRDYPVTLPMALDGVDDVGTFVGRWVSAAEAEWVDLLLPLAGRAPDDSPADEWDETIVWLLSEWARRRPGEIVPRLEAGLAQERYRPAILAALADLREQIGRQGDP